MLILGMAIAGLLKTLNVQAAYSSNGPNVMYYWGQVSGIQMPKGKFLLMIRTLLVARQLKVHYQAIVNQAKQTSSSCRFSTYSM